MEDEWEEKFIELEELLESKEVPKCVSFYMSKKIQKKIPSAMMLTLYQNFVISWTIKGQNFCLLEKEKNHTEH